MRAQSQDRFGNASKVAAPPSAYHARAISRQIWRCMNSGGATVSTTCAHNLKTDSAMHRSGNATVSTTCAHNLKADFGNAFKVAAQLSAQHTLTILRQLWRCIRSDGATASTTCARNLKTDLAMHGNLRHNRQHNMRGMGEALSQRYIHVYIYIYIYTYIYIYIYVYINMYIYI